jgi:hypothetical protein
VVLVKACAGGTVVMICMHLSFALSMHLAWLPPPVCVSVPLSCIHVSDQPRVPQPKKREETSPF